MREYSEIIERIMEIIGDMDEAGQREAIRIIDSFLVNSQ